MNNQQAIKQFGSDLISRQAAIDALETVGYDFSESELSEVELEEVCGAVSDVRQDMMDRIKQLPPAQPAQLAPDRNGDLWITVPDIDKVTRIFVQEGKSKFCRIFYEEQELPEPYKGVTT